MASPTEPISPELLALLRCPETMQELSLAPAELLERLAREGKRIEAGLLRQDGRKVYPIRNGIPVLLVEEGITV